MNDTTRVPDKTALEDFDHWEPNILVSAWFHATVRCESECPVGREWCENGSPQRGWDICPSFMGIKDAPASADLGTRFRACCATLLHRKGEKP